MTDDEKLQRTVHVLALELSETNVHLKKIEEHLWWLALGVIISIITLIVAFFASITILS